MGQNVHCWEIFFKRKITNYKSHKSHKSQRNLGFYLGYSSYIKRNTVYCKTTIELNQENEFYYCIDEALCLSGPQACKPIKLASIGYVTMCSEMGWIWIRLLVFLFI